MASAHVPTRAAAHGKGRAVLEASGDEAIFSSLSYRYPLKLLSPQTIGSNVPLAIAYMLSYGGGLVSGDKIDLDVNIGEKCALMLLTQGSTKVFKTRTVPSTSALGGSSNSSAATQRLTVTLQPSSSLILLPDPITCFASSSYSQSQTFRLPSLPASAIILDWFTSGRMARDEEWAFERYRSSNEIWLGGRRIVRDVMLLEKHSPVTFTSSPETRNSIKGKLPPRALKDRLAPYACYATLFLLGPLASSIITNLAARFDKIQQMQAAKPDALLWSMSPLSIPSSPSAPSSDQGEGNSRREEGGNERGAIVRVAGMETELVREWLKDALKPLEDHIGADAYRTAFI